MSTGARTGVLRLAALAGVALGAAAYAAPSAGAERAPAPRTAEPADLEFLEFLGGDDEVESELGEFLARPAREPAPRPDASRPATPAQEKAR